MTSVEQFSSYLFSRVKFTFLLNSFMLWAYTQFCEKNSLYNKECNALCTFRKAEPSNYRITGTKAD